LCHTCHMSQLLLLLRHKPMAHTHKSSLVLRAAACCCCLCCVLLLLLVLRAAAAACVACCCCCLCAAAAALACVCACARLELHLPSPASPAPKTTNHTPTQPKHLAHVSPPHHVPRSHPPRHHLDVRHPLRPRPRLHHDGRHAQLRRLHHILQRPHSAAAALHLVLQQRAAGSDSWLLPIFARPDLRESTTLGHRLRRLPARRSNPRLGPHRHYCRRRHPRPQPRCNHLRSPQNRTPPPPPPRTSLPHLPPPGPPMVRRFHPRLFLRRVWLVLLLLHPAPRPNHRGGAGRRLWPAARVRPRPLPLCLSVTLVTHPPPMSFCNTLQQLRPASLRPALQPARGSSSPCQRVLEAVATTVKVCSQSCCCRPSRFALKAAVDGRQGLLSKLLLTAVKVCSQSFCEVVCQSGREGCCFKQQRRACEGSCRAWLRRECAAVDARLHCVKFNACVWGQQHNVALRFTRTAAS